MKYINYGAMQSEAQRRVSDMQQKAYNAVYSRQPPISVQLPEPPPYNPPETDCGSAAHSVHDDCTPCAVQCSAEINEPCCEPKSEQIPSQKKLPQRDPEQMLLLALLVLVITENADITLVLALLYLLL